MTGVTLIAGNGVLPAIFARGARGAGLSVAMISHIGETLPASEELADALKRIGVGQAGAIMKAVKAFGNREVAFVGGINKTGLLSGARPDLLALRLYRASRDRRDDTLLRAFARHIESDGFEVVSCTKYCPELLAKPGRIGRKKASPSQQEDAAYGLKLLEALGPYSTGQSVIVKDGNVLAVEAAEGTDGAISRVASMRVKGASLVKAAKPGQDLRFDVPAAGPLTMERCATAGITALFMESGRTMFLGLEESVAAADRLGIAVTGI